MTLDTVWGIVHSVLRKEPRGNILKPDGFTDLLQQCHLEYYNQQYEKWAASQTILDSLRPFVVLDESITFVSGEEDIADLASPYKHAISARTSSDIPIDIVSQKVWGGWIGDAVMAGTAYEPIMTFDVSKLYISPIVISDVKLSYLAACVEDGDLSGSDTSTDYYLPYFDYYTDANDIVQYLPNGTDHVLTSGETYRDGTADSGTVTGVSHELKWGDTDIVNIISLILEKLGVGMQSPDVTQYAMALQQKQNVV